MLHDKNSVKDYGHRKRHHANGLRAIQESHIHPHGCRRYTVRHMSVVISLLRGVNVVGRNKIKMEGLRALYEANGLRDVQTYIQSGNVVFRTKGTPGAGLAQRIEAAIEKSHGFRPSVMIRTTAELRSVIKRNPFAGRSDIEPSKLIVLFLNGKPTRDGCEKVRAIQANFPEEVHCDGLEVFFFFPEGMGLSKLPMAKIEKALGFSGTARNWNTVTKLLEMAEKLDGA